jgi:hypothetical protein
MGMGKLFDQIRKAVREEKFIVSNHADDRLRERSIELWQILAGLDGANLLSERPGDKPHPSVEVLLNLADGTPVKVVWSWVDFNGVAILVTVHFIDR